MQRRFVLQVVGAAGPLCAAALIFAEAAISTPQSQPAPAQVESPVAAEQTTAIEPETRRVEDALRKGIEVLLALQEGDARAEWPYEGVYRVEGAIPIGYRIGGTAISAMALMAAPGYEDDPERRAAVRRATQFIISGLDHPLMGAKIEGRYDVRGWGYTYALHLLLELRERALVPDDLSDSVDQAIRAYIGRIAATEIPQSGGWNYSRRAGFDQPSPQSAFMTAPTLQALFRARARGFEVDAKVIDRGVAALQRGRIASGAFAYAGDGGAAKDGLPGAIGRTLAAETTLQLCGHSTQAHLRSALDDFFTHWRELDKRRAQPGTHAPPFGVAPYYFYYAHYFAAQAIEQLPDAERADYRRKLTDLLFSVRQADGSWNDRVFPRSASFGTAMTMLALRMPQSPPPARWLPDGGGGPGPSAPPAADPPAVKAE
jgi:hypothetical protein